MEKYHNVITNGYASKAEARRAYELQMMERARKISNLRQQVPFEVVPKQEGERPAVYIADFVYINEQGQQVVEDVKGVRTREYILKRKLMLHVHGIRIKEVA
jgi:hypothetical protein